MKFVSVDDIDDFDIEVIFWIGLSDLPQNIQDEARRLDGEYYNPGCFGTCVCLETEKNEYCFSPDEKDTNVFYVKNDGNKAWFMVEMDEPLIHEIFSACANEYSKNTMTVLDDNSVTDSENEDELEL